MQIGFRRAVEGVVQQQPQITRERIRHDALALNQPGIAVAGLLCRAAPVDQYDLTSACL